MIRPHHPIRLLVARVVGAELRRLRIRAGMSQSRVALLTGISRPVISRIERGRDHAPLIETAWKFSEACGGTLFDVLSALDRALGLTNTVGN